MKDTGISGNLKAIQQSFDNDPAKLTMVRAQQPIPEAILDTCWERAEKLMPHGLLRPHNDSDTVQLDAAKQPTSWIFLKNADHAAYEKEYLPSLRIVTHGSRQVVCAHYTDLCDWMIGTAAVPAGALPSPNKVKNHFKAMSKENFENYVRLGFDLFTATVGPGEAVYLPPMMVFAERSLGEASLVGFRFVPSILCPQSHTRLEKGSGIIKMT